MPTPVPGGESALLEEAAASAPGPFVFCAVGVARVRHGNLQGRILICISFTFIQPYTGQMTDYKLDNVICRYSCSF